MSRKQWEPRVRRVRRVRPVRQAMGVLVVAVIGVAVVGVAGVAGCSREAAPAGGSGTMSTSVASSSTSGSTPTRTSTVPAGKQLTGVPVYWIGETARSMRLYREFRSVPDTGGRIASAVAAMTRMTPLDPDYRTPWTPASRVTARQAGTALTVDLSADAIAGRNVGSELADRAVQQLIYTATAAAGSTPVRTVTITVDGKPADAWGAVRLGAPMTRARQVDVLSHAWLTAPQEGERRPAGTVTFSGYGTSFEATFGWTVTDAAGQAVVRGSATGGTGTGGFGSFTFAAKLAPGAYTVELRTDDPSDGEGPGPMSDTKRFIVR